MLMGSSVLTNSKPVGAFNEKGNSKHLFVISSTNTSQKLSCNFSNSLRSFSLSIFLNFQSIPHIFGESSLTRS